MPMKITVRRETEVPRPTAGGKVNEELEALKAKMRSLEPGMVLEIDAGNMRSVRGTKTLITRAARELGANWKHWHAGKMVFAQPARRRRRRRRSAS